MPALSEHELKERFDRILKSSEDSAVTVLKGHLLVEEMLDSYLSTIFTDEKAYDQARLSFAQKCHLVLSHVDFPSWYEDESADEDTQLVKLTFDYVVSLNRLRNKLAHNAEYAGLECDMRADLGLDETASGSEVVKEIRGHIFYLYYYLQGYISGAFENYEHPRKRMRQRSTE